jgi:hypothetical protein
MSLNNKTILINGGIGSFEDAFVSHLLKKYQQKNNYFLKRGIKKKYNENKFIEKSIRLDYGFDYSSRKHK